MPTTAVQQRSAGAPPRPPLSEDDRVAPHPVPPHPAMPAAFGGARMYCYVFADKVSTKWRHQRRVVVLTALFALCCDEAGGVRRLVELSQVLEAVVVAAMGDRDLPHVLLRFRGEEPDLLFRWRSDSRSSVQTPSAFVAILEKLSRARPPHTGISVTLDARLPVAAIAKLAHNPEPPMRRLSRYSARGVQRQVLPPAGAPAAPLGPAAAEAAAAAQPVTGAAPTAPATAPPMQRGATPADSVVTASDSASSTGGGITVRAFFAGLAARQEEASADGPPKQGAQRPQQPQRVSFAGLAGCVGGCVGQEGGEDRSEDDGDFTGNEDAAPAQQGAAARPAAPQQGARLDRGVLSASPREPPRGSVGAAEAAPPPLPLMAQDAAGRQGPAAQRSPQPAASGRGGLITVRAEPPRTEPPRADPPEAAAAERPGPAQGPQGRTPEGRRPPPQRRDLTALAAGVHAALGISPAHRAPADDSCASTDSSSSSSPVAAGKGKVSPRRRSPLPASTSLRVPARESPKPGKASPGSGRARVLLRKPSERLTEGAPSPPARRTHSAGQRQRGGARGALSADGGARVVPPPRRRSANDALRDIAQLLDGPPQAVPFEGPPGGGATSRRPRSFSAHSGMARGPPPSRLPTAVSARMIEHGSAAQLSSSPPRAGGPLGPPPPRPGGPSSGGTPPGLSAAMMRRL
eukprot:TRINITY_DN4964_c1_g1_i1.p1 TRINITY_DN4964_c1_g1~~TRINITY_DN4964_c1_g1_i1.p1  ORF type:complete len:714 (+),score=198.97 TRINITY_DN4964_c1_g1_i1:76-2142(+)